MHEIIVIYSFMLLQALRLGIEMKNLNLQVTLPVQKVGKRVSTPKKVWERRSHPVAPVQNSSLFRKNGWFIDISLNSIS